MAYNRFLLNQLLPAGNDKTIYELILDEPYSAGRKPSDAADSLVAKTPADVAVGSKATYITEDANGNRIVWKFTYQQTAVSETGWVITKVLEGGMAPIPLEVTENAKYEGNGATAYTPVDVDVPNPSTGTLQITANNTYDVTSYASAEVNVPNPSTGTLRITENGEGIDVSSYAYADVSVSGGVTFPVFTEGNDAWSCDMTYEQISALEDYADSDDALPCHSTVVGDSKWELGYFVSGADLGNFVDVPVGVTEGFVFHSGNWLFGDDGNYYPGRSS